jgi:hypothetical protein
MVCETVEWRDLTTVASCQAAKRKSACRYVVLWKDMEPSYHDAGVRSLPRCRSMRFNDKDSIAAVAGFAGPVTPRLATYSASAYLHDSRRMECGEQATGMTAVESQTQNLIPITEDNPCGRADSSRRG